MPEPQSDLSVVIAAYNEAAGIATVLETLRSALPESEIIVVDDASSDRTADLARAHAGVRVYRHPFNRGQGAALKTGMLLATRRYVAWFDADNEHRVEDLDRLLRIISGKHVAAVIGQRTTGSATRVRGVGKFFIRLVGRGLGIKAGSDLNCGLRVFRREVILRYLPLIPNRFSASLVSTLVMLEQRYPILFEPVETNPRIGNSSVRLRDGFEATLQLIRAILLFAPMRFFLPIGLVSLGIGIIYSLFIAMSFGLGIPVAGMLLILASVLVIMLGLIADQISQMRVGALSGSAAVEVGPDDAV